MWTASAHDWKDELARRRLSAVSLAELARLGRPVTEPWFDRWLHG